MIGRRIQIADSPQAIVLIHGLESQGSLGPVRAKLTADFPNVTVVDLNRMDSGTSPISQQAKDAFEELKRMDIVGKEIVLIGDSQGGLVAWELYDSYKDQLNVKQLITNHTPWEGVPIATITQKLLIDLHKFQTFLLMSTDASFGSLQNIFSQNPAIGDGISDLKPNSSFLNKVAAHVKDAEIPILAIGGTIDPISGLSILAGMNPEVIRSQLYISGADEKYIQDLIRPISGKFIGNRENDSFIPLSSQLAVNLPTNAQFERLNLREYHHFVAMDEEPIYNLILKILKKHFARKPNVPLERILSTSFNF